MVSVLAQLADRRRMLRGSDRVALTSFGGPIAHLGYFRDEIVVRRRWLGWACVAIFLLTFVPVPLQP